MSRLQTVENLGVTIAAPPPPQSQDILFPGVTAGSLLVLVVSVNSSDQSNVAAVTDDVNGVWTRAVSVPWAQAIYGFSFQVGVWFCLNALAGDTTVSVDFTASTDLLYVALEGAEYGGVAGGLLGVTGTTHASLIQDSGDLAVFETALVIAGLGDGDYGNGWGNFHPVDGSVAGSWGSNLLSGNDSVFTTDTSGYQAGDDTGGFANTLLTREAPPVAPPGGATYALRIGSTGSASGYAITAPTHAVPVTGGNEYQVSADLLAQADATTVPDIWVGFYDASGALLEQYTRSVGSIDSTAWTHFVGASAGGIDIQPPFGAALMRVAFTSSSGTDDLWVTNIAVEEKAFNWAWDLVGVAGPLGDSGILLADQGAATGAAAGSYRMRVRVDDPLPLRATFVLAFGWNAPPTPPPPVPPSAVVKWQFYDPVTTATEQFHINPQTGASPAYTKRLTREITSTGIYDANIGAVIAFEQGDEPVKLKFSGLTLDEDDYELFARWFDKAYPVYVVDDLGRWFKVVLERYTPKRVWKATVGWYHSYDIEALVLMEGGP